MKALVILLDGAPEPEGSVFEKARTPFLDRLASQSLCGLWTGPEVPKGYNIKSLSELGMLGIFGYSPSESPGRGFMEALALGIETKKNAVYLRANFATVDEGLRITDRRAGRDDSFLEKISRDLNTTIDNVSFRFVKGKGHRGVLVMEGDGLNNRISDVDSGGNKPADVRALEKNAAETAHALNHYLKWSHSLLKNHPLNKKRKVSANYLLLRSAGMKKPIQSFFERFGKTAGAVGNDTIFNGICAYLGMEVFQTKETKEIEDNLEEKLQTSLTLLGKKDIVFLHIKGTDTLSHDKNISGKARFIEGLDQKIFSKIPQNILLSIISDHCTSSVTGEHCAGEIPFLVYNGKQANGIKRFAESHCRKGFREDNPIKKIISLL